MDKKINNILSNNQVLSDTIFDILREKILKGDYQQGEKIKEKQIADELNVSRTPVRECFKQLEQEGLIENIPNRGAFVIGFTKQDIEALYEIRRAVESIAITWAIDRISEEELKQLQEVYELMEFYTQKNDVEKIMEINTEFHEIIHTASKSRFISQILKSCQFYVKEARKAALTADRLIESLKEHKAILDCLYNHDEEKAVEVMSLHLNNAKLRAKEGMDFL